MASPPEVPGPRPGTLEWLTDQQPDQTVLLTPEGALTRAQWEARAEALAEHLATEHDVAQGDLLSGAGRLGPEWFVLSWAAAKLGAGLAGLPPGPVVADVGALHVDRDLLAAAGDGELGAPRRRLSGTAPPPDAITFSRLGRSVLRSFPPGGVPAIGTTLADLVDRLRAAPGTTLVACAPVSDPVAGFLASVVLVGGGRVLIAERPEAALALAAEHEAGLAALAPADLDAVTHLPEAAREALDLTTLVALVVGAAPFDRAAAEDLFGPDGVLDVYATADTGIVAVRAGEEPHHTILDGVSARESPGGLLEVRSPLAAGPGWVATGDRGAVLGSTLLLS